MPHEEKRAWIMLAVSLTAYLVYVVVVLRRAAGRALAETPYAGVLLWTVGGAIVAAVAAEAVVGLSVRREVLVTAVRDREIGRLGEHTGQSFVVVGAVAAMLMAMAGWDRFWIANVIYLCFVLSAVLGSITKIAVYRGTFPQW